MPHASRDLDVRPVQPALRYAEVVRVFETLVADEAIVLLTDEDPKPLLLEFQTQQTGRFEWSILEAGPGRFRVTNTGGLTRDCSRNVMPRTSLTSNTALDPDGPMRKSAA